MRRHTYRFHSSLQDRRGAVLVLAALMMVGLTAFVSIVVDLGYLVTARAEMQRTADAAALAGVWQYAETLSSGGTTAEADSAARNEAATFAGLNAVCRSGPALDLNSYNLPEGEIVLGYIDDFTNPDATLDRSDPSKFNAARVTVHKTEGQNGKVPFFFAKILGHDGHDAEATATAVFAREIQGFTTPPAGQTLDILPIAVDVPTWNELLAGCLTSIVKDDWTYNADGSITAGADGMLEINIYPKGNGSPGNRGTVDIGSNNNSTSDICRQILYGISAEDMSYMGGTLQFNDCGKLYLNGDTGISAGIKDELEAIKGQPRVIPIFSQVNGNGNNAMYTIVKFAGIRIMDVELTGNKNMKRVVVQQCPITLRNIIPAEGGSSTSDFVYSPVILLN